MVEHLEYRYKPETRRGGPLEVVVPKTFLDEVTGSRGPILDELKMKGQRLMGRRHDVPGGVVLDFDLETNGVPYFAGPAWTRVGHTLSIIAQLEIAAARRDVSDPRFCVTIDSDSVHGFDLGDLRVSFDRPSMDDNVFQDKMRDGMIHAADLCHQYNASDHSDVVAIDLDNEKSLDVYMGPFRRDRRLIFQTAPNTPLGKRIDLHKTGMGDKGERFAAIIGVIATLDPIQ